MSLAEPSNFFKILALPGLRMPQVSRRGEGYERSLGPECRLCRQCRTFFVSARGGGVSARSREGGTKVTGKIKKGNLALARRIRAAGIAIHINEDDEEAPRDPSTGLLVYQAGGVSE